MENNKRIIKVGLSIICAIAVLGIGITIIAFNFKKDNSDELEEIVMTTKVTTTTEEITTEASTTTTTTTTTTKKNSTNKKTKTTTTTYNPISELTINKPKEYTIVNDIKDIDLEYSGGDNADEVNVYIYENNKLIKKETISTNKYTISSTNFKLENAYRIVVEATKENKYKRNDTIYINVIKTGRQNVVDLAVKQEGNKGTTYWSWYGYSGFVEWCAIFVSWIANQNGYLDTIIPKFKGCGSGVKWFKEHNQFKLRSSGYVPLPGDIIFFDYYPENTMIDHVGYVIKADEKYVYTVEGNVGSPTDKSTRKVKLKKYELNKYTIYGYAIPKY